jgi:hypothetical protein
VPEQLNLAGELDWAEAGEIALAVFGGAGDGSRSVVNTLALPVAAMLRVFENQAVILLIAQRFALSLGQNRQ